MPENVQISLTASDLEDLAPLSSDMRAWRDRMGWTQTVAATELGITRRSIAGYEAGTQAIPRAVALACITLTMAHGK